MRDMPPERREVPAVVVGGSLNALGVVRSLSRARIPVLLLETTRGCPAVWSRHCTYVRVPSLEGEGLIDALVRLASGLGCRPVLMLTTDESVLAVSASRHRIEPLYHFDLPEPAVVAALADKAQFHMLAEREALAVPRGRIVLGMADLDRIGELEPPLIIKPADKTLVEAGLVARAVCAGTHAQAGAAAAQMLSHAPSLIVQEWVEGPDTEIFFALFSCGRGGEPTGIFPGRKLVCSPPAIGSTAVCVAAPEVAEELCRQTRHFVERVGYRGIGSLEFKRGPTGRFIIIEPTVGRTDWQEEIATLCGLNIPALAYRIALGDTAPPADDVAQQRYAWRSDRRFAVPHDLVAPRTRVIDGYFRWSDPLPGFYHYGHERLTLRLWRRAHRLTCKSFEQTVRAH